MDKYARLWTLDLRKGGLFGSQFYLGDLGHDVLPFLHLQGRLSTRRYAMQCDHYHTSDM